LIRYHCVRATVASVEICMVIRTHKVKSKLYRKARARLDDIGPPVLLRNKNHTASGVPVIGVWGWFERIVLVATLLSIAIGLWAFRIDYDDRVQDRVVRKETLVEIEAAQKTRREDAIARAWTLLTTPATGNSGKVAAMEFLVAEKVPLVGIDLSCDRMGGGWDAEKFTCQRPTYLRGAKIAGAVLDGANLSGVDLSGSDLRGVSMVRANLDGAVLNDLDMTSAKLPRSSMVRTEVRKTKLDGVDLTGANAERAIITEATADEAILTGASLHRAIFRDVSAKEADIFLADFSEATLLGADFSFVKLGDPPGSTSSPWVSDSQHWLYPKVGFGWVSFEGANLCGVRFSNSTLMFGNLRASKMFAVQFDGADISEADLTDSVISSGFTCRDPDRSRPFVHEYFRTNSEGVTFRNSNISRTRFDNRYDFDSVYEVVGDETDARAPSKKNNRRGKKISDVAELSKAWAWDTALPIGVNGKNYRLLINREPWVDCSIPSAPHCG